MHSMPVAAAVCLLMVSGMVRIGFGADVPKVGDRLTDEQVSGFARLALKGIEKEYPNKPSDILLGTKDVRAPREVHPVFYGCFDWHSSVHGHWMLLKLLKEHPKSSVAEEIRSLLRRQLTAEKIKIETDYFDVKDNASFERMYGWAWALKLAAELRTFDDAEGKVWAANFVPLEKRIVELTKGYLPKLTYPVRTGVHPDTAFALAWMLDYARVVKDTEFEKAIGNYAREKYLKDTNYPSAYEPSGEDFFSPCLNESDLMRRVLGPEEFAAWLTGFLPGLTEGSNLLVPAEVSDISDPKIGHLAGLNFSRGWTQRGIAGALPAGDPRRVLLEKSSAAHGKAGLGFVFSGHYEGEHWLATYAITYLGS
jgi:hypothetical protein